jgi:pyruvate dehydrogenase E1 component alpha subunit
MYWDTFDGEHMYELRAGMANAIERAHKESRPSIVEVATYRYKGHSVADANALKYRTKEEVEKYQRNHDPIQLWGDQLLREGVLTEDAAADIHREARQEAEASARFADQSPFPDVSDITTDIYWEVDNGTPAAAHGRYFFND